MLDPAIECVSTNPLFNCYLTNVFLLWTGTSKPNMLHSKANKGHLVCISWLSYDYLWLLPHKVRSSNWPIIILSKWKPFSLWNGSRMRGKVLTVKWYPSTKWECRRVSNHSCYRSYQMIKSHLSKWRDRCLINARFPRAIGDRFWLQNKNCAKNSSKKKDGGKSKEERPL